MLQWSLLLVLGSAFAATKNCRPTLMKSTMVANCQAQGHLTVPEIDSSTEVLLLSFNRISDITQSSFPRLANIRTLMLGLQELAFLYVREDAFKNLRNLTFLDLGGNKKIFLHPDSFSGLEKLEVLLLDANGIDDTILEKGYFRHLVSLKKLDLSANQIKRIQPDPSFQNLKMLSSLHLKLNKIDLVCGKDLQHLQGHHLSLLDLSSNRLSYREPWQNESACSNPFYNITIDTLDISSNPWNIDSVERFFKTMLGTQILHLKMQYPGGIGRSFGFRNLQDFSATTFSGLNKSNVLSLDISHGSLFELSAYVFSGFPQLNTLNLASNKINRVNLHAFAGLQSLIMLNLSYNLLGEIYSDSFESLRSSPIRYLSLKSNHIGAIQHNALSGLNSLQTLDLRDNSLLHIPPMQLPGLKQALLGENRIRNTFGIQAFASRATLIDLAYNRLENLGEFWDLMTIPTLEILFLSHNWISRCSVSPRNAVPQNSSLRVLDLSHNSLETVWRSGSCWNIFQGLDKLISLNLSKTYLSFLPENLFQGLQSLQTLDLSGNIIVSLPENLFQDLRSLKVLRLNDNNFVTLTPSTLDMLPSLALLDLTDTSFVCHCGLKDFVIWLQATNISFRGLAEEIPCFRPQLSLLEVPLLTFVEDNCM
ncbi:vacuolar protein sorting-associated protein 51 homolog isoform X4 [Rhinatrema bivittatum]|uniref:vacuolar protein sorting-associated protein 51 homolog isoform X4 n=1 Tax=Rhinatrema bivittatum TaxID=194408 RepID=UPI00112BCCC9|nr:vacuolar protein sorting-associated protein 51 homolog isoform X4 [Rhinatrema bivittatum]